jgi:hypothetical protein
MQRLFLSRDIETQRTRVACDAARLRGASQGCDEARPASLAAEEGDLGAGETPVCMDWSVAWLPHRQPLCPPEIHPPPPLPPPHTPLPRAHADELGCRGGVLIRWLAEQVWHCFRDFGPGPLASGMGCSTAADDDHVLVEVFDRGVQSDSYRAGACDV